MKNFAKTLLARYGYQLKHLPAEALPQIHELGAGKLRFKFWLTNEHALAWWKKDRLDDSAESEFLEQVCREDSVAFDVGAHHGMQTMIMALLSPSGSVHAFEANPPNALTLHANIALNRLQNCYPNLAAVGARQGEIDMAGETVGQASLEQWTVPMLQLDVYCKEHGIEQVDVLKVDVEGFEGEVLQGASHLLSKRPHINLELHRDDLANYGWTVDRVLDLLPFDDEGYEVSIMDRHLSWTDRQRFQRNTPIQSPVVNLFFVNTDKLA